MRMMDILLIIIVTYFNTLLIFIFHLFDTTDTCVRRQSLPPRPAFSVAA